MWKSFYFCWQKKHRKNVDLTWKNIEKQFTDPSSAQNRGWTLFQPKASFEHFSCPKPILAPFLSRKQVLNPSSLQHSTGLITNAKFENSFLDNPRIAYWNSSQNNNITESGCDHVCNNVHFAFNIANVLVRSCEEETSSENITLKWEMSEQGI